MHFFPNSDPGSDLQEMWSDEARAAAARARGALASITAGHHDVAAHKGGGKAGPTDAAKHQKEKDKARRERQRVNAKTHAAARTAQHQKLHPRKVQYRHLKHVTLSRTKIGPRSGGGGTAARSSGGGGGGSTSTPNRVAGPVANAREVAIILREGQADIKQRFGVEQFEYPTPTSQIKHIGFAPKTQTWYGWSHRAVFGFKVGSTIRKGDVIAPDPQYPLPKELALPLGFTAKTLADARRMAAAFAIAVS